MIAALVAATTLGTGLGWLAAVRSHLVRPAAEEQAGTAPRASLPPRGARGATPADK